MEMTLRKFSHLMFSFIALMAIPTAATFAQSINPQWKHDLQVSLQEFRTCNGENDGKACSTLIGESLKKVYNVNDFYSSSLKRYMKASEIAGFVKENTKWTLLGKSFDQSVLAAAQESANNRKAVVAVYQDESGLGHVVLIVPGALTPSGSWGLKVPSAASFLVTDPEKSFVDKGLSFAFTKSMMKDIVLYVRQY